MADLSERDLKVLKLLRFGIMPESRVVLSLFDEGSDNNVNKGFAKFNSERLGKAAIAFDLATKEFFALSVKTCQMFDGDNIGEVLSKLNHLSSVYGKKYLRANPEIKKVMQFFEVRFNESSVDDLSAKVVVEDMTRILLERFESILENEKDKAERARGVRRCRSVMVRLIRMKYIAEIEIERLPSADTETRFYYLTKKKGLPFVSSLLSAEVDKGEIRTANYNPVHAVHDSMVTQVIHTIYMFQNKGSYTVEKVWNEAYIKAEYYKELMKSKKRNKKKALFWATDIQIQVRSNGTEAQRVKYNIEIDNGTQSFSNIHNKVKIGLPIIIVCNTSERANFLMHELVNYYKNKNLFFITSFHQFQVGGLYGSKGLCSPLGEAGRLGKMTAVKARSVR